MPRVYPDLETMFLERGVRRRDDGSFAEDSYDYGVWWRSRDGGVHRLTWIGPQMRDDPAKAGELYLVRLSGPYVGSVSLEQVRERGSLVAEDHLDVLLAGSASGHVELLCVIPPLPPIHDGDRDPHEPMNPWPRIRVDENVENILDGWAEVCGKLNSVAWVRDRVWEALRAGWATDVKNGGEARDDEPAVRALRG